MPLQAFAADLHTLDVELAFSTQASSGKTHAGYRLYQDGNLVCETLDTNSTVMTCEFLTEEGACHYTLSALYTDGSESPPSDPFPFAITCTDPPSGDDGDTDPPPTGNGANTISYAWDSSASTNSVAGYRMYMNDTMLCETANQSASSLSCNADLINEQMAFAIASYDENNLESEKSNFLTLDPSDTGSPTDPPTDPPAGELNALATASPNIGAAPLSVTFDGSDSTGPIASYSWQFGDGTSANGSVVDHLYATPGTYSAKLVVTDDDGKTALSSITVNVKEGDPVLSPPSAAIASSIITGDAPADITFDGSGSTATNSPILSYQWDLGDGTTATGRTVTHQYTEAGSYDIQLVVMDSAGLSDSTISPILITDTPTINEPPKAVISTTGPTQGDAPLTVTLNGSQSFDPDGSIVSYSWDFGDGNTASGERANHTYVNDTDYTAKYTATLRVTDDTGNTSILATRVISVNSSMPQTAFNYEIGEVEIDNNWVEVVFENTFEDPVVIISPLSTNSIEPAVTRMRNLTKQGFEVCLQEWEYLDGRHIPEKVSYIVVEKGLTTLADGTKIEAGTFTSASDAEIVSFRQDFLVSPVILTSIASENDPQTVTGRVDNSSAESFSFMLQEEEAADGIHHGETITYLAWEPGSGTDGTLTYEASITPDAISDTWNSIEYQGTFSSMPYFFAGMQSITGSNTACLRMTNPAEAKVDLRIEEEQSKDKETNHRAESVGYLILGSESDTSPEDQPDIPEIKRVMFNWQFDSLLERRISGFKIYNNQQLICESGDSTQRQLTCEIPLDSSSNVFVVRAIEATGLESEPSNGLELRF